MARLATERKTSFVASDMTIVNFRRVIGTMVQLRGPFLAEILLATTKNFRHVLAISLYFVFVASPPASQAETATLIGTADVDGINGVNPGVSGTDRREQSTRRQGQLAAAACSSAPRRFLPACLLA